MTDLGYRFCRVEEHRLVSPFAYLPVEDGLLTAHCPHPHTTPWPGCQCGISYYPTRRDAVTAAQWLTGTPYAITEGQVLGTNLPDVHMAPYNAGFGRWVTIPPGRRAHQYRITNIWTDTPVTHDIPTHPLASLP